MHGLLDANILTLLNNKLKIKGLIEFKHSNSNNVDTLHGGLTSDLCNKFGKKIYDDVDLTNLDLGVQVIFKVKVVIKPIFINSNIIDKKTTKVY